MPSPTDFNVSPYYDDFTESKKFHRILFRPAFAVQARELTQSQTQIQNQIESLSDHLFDKGAMIIPGEIGYDLNYYAVKLTSKSASTLTDYVDTTLTGGTSGVTAKVVNAVVTDGTDPDTLFVKYMNTASDGSTISFTNGETLTSDGSGNPTVVVASTATGSAAQIKQGIYYINGYHVQVSAQTLILDKYSSTPSYRVGLTVTESFVTPGDDTTLNDNAQGVSNTNAPGAHRFKILLTLAKKALNSTEDSNFYELLRLSSGVLQNQVRTTDYAVLEDTLARRTFDESGDYVVRPFDIDVREHLISGTNRGIYTGGQGGDATKLAVGFSPGKAYVKGYEINTISTTYVDVDKARDYDTQGNFNTRFDVGNFVNVTNVYGSPDIVTASGVEAFKGLTLHNTATSSRGTANAGANSNITTIGRAKTRGFEYSSGTATGNIFSNASITSAVYKHHLFDVVLFTHLNITTAQAYSDGVTITGGTSGATGIVQESSTVESATITGATAANPVVVTATNKFKEGQQITITGVAGMTELNGNVYTVRNPTSSNFQLYDTDGTSSINGGSYSAWSSSSGVATHGVVILSNVQGIFQASESITDGSSASTIQANAVGLKGVTTHDISSVKQIAMAGSPTFTADTSLDATSGDNATLTGTLSIANSGTAVTGFNTRFTDELRVGDSISFTTDAGSSLTKIVEAIISNSSISLLAAVGGSDVSTKTIATRRRAKMQSPEKNVSIFKLPYENIKTLKTTANSNVSDTTYSFRKHSITTLTGDGIATFSAGVNETFADLSEGDYTISITSTGGGGTGAVGDVLSLTGNNHESSAIFALNGAKTTLTLDFGANYAGHDIKALVTLHKTVGTSKTKTLNAASTVAISTQATIVSGTIGLAKADVKQINNVYMAADFSTAADTSDTDISSRFELDTGQRDNFYDIGRIKLKTGELTPTGRLLVNFDYYSHSSGDYFDVDSYSAISYTDIPAYTSSNTGVRYELRDSLDFRPRVDDEARINRGYQDRDYNGTGASTVDVAKFGSDISSDLEYYLSRIDKIFVDKDGKFQVARGASSLIPQAPKNLDGAMHLYTLDIPAYTLTPEDIDITKVDNKRYTMRDIGRLENRLENTEYYTQLSLLEMQAANLQIQDADGFDRFKNGFLVDNFTGHSVGDAGNLDYKVSMDMAKGEMRPMFHEDAVQLIEADDDGTSITALDRTDAKYAKTGDCMTLPYTETTLIDQPFASKFVNVNPFDVFSWAGNIQLTPPSDEWKETERMPELVINRTGSFDTLVQSLGNPNLTSVAIGTVWNDWQEFWSGTPQELSRSNVGNIRRGRRVMQRTAITERGQLSATRTGIRSRIVPQVVRTSIGDRVVSVGFVPFIRSRTLTFIATRMKPETRVYPFFDNIDVASYITPNGGSLGGNLVTNINGMVTGTFSIPDPKVNSNPRWRTGQRVFRLTSSVTNNLSTAVQTSAEADYVAKGALDTVQETIISTREAQTVRESTVETVSRGTQTRTRITEQQIGWHDPLSQTFMIDDAGGVFATSVDLYFSSKDSNIPVTVQIREVVNGYPGKRILPFSEKTLNPSSVNISTDATTATTFTFDSPVYLQENTEYCFVVMAMTNNYNCYVGRLGEKVINSDRTISQQPYAGVLFKSQNGSTWTAEQNEDIKFKIKRAEFENVTGTVTLCNDVLPTRTLKTNAIRTTNTSGVIRISHPNHGMHGTSNNVTIAGVPSATYNGIVHSDINGTYTSISNVTLDSYDVTTSGTATATGDIGGSAITATQNRAYDVLNLNLATATVPGTNITYAIRPTTGRSIHGNESEFSLTSSANAISAIAGDNIWFNAPNMVASDINQTNEMSGNKSLFVNLTFTTSNTKLSPVLDMARVSAYTIQNRLNSATSFNTPNYVADTEASGTSSAGVYVTKPIVLENLSTALDIRMTSNVRATSSVLVYYRLSSSEEARKIDDIGWTAFNDTGLEDTTVTPAEDDDTFREYKYSASGLNEFTTFQLKVVMKGTNSSYPPVMKDLRGIALAV